MSFYTHQLISDRKSPLHIFWLASYQPLLGSGKGSGAGGAGGAGVLGKLYNLVVSTCACP